MSLAHDNSAAWLIIEHQILAREIKFLKCHVESSSKQIVSGLVSGDLDK